MFKKILKIFCAILVCVFILCSISVWCSYNVLTETYYTVSSDLIDNSFRIVFISDLHDHQFGENNIQLVQRIEAQEPDIIILDGDMINRDSEDSNAVTGLVRQLVEFAPVYYSLGNHEYDYIENGHDELLNELSDAGATVLNYAIADVTINGNEVRLGGLYEYGFDTSMQTDEESENAVAYMERFSASDCYLIMCAHRPESFYCWDIADSWGIDLQLSGHLHGGQVILPFLGGLYSSLEGFFPKYDYGIYDVGECSMIITRGLGSNKKTLPRFNNLPEIVVIDVD